jgi:hypothetical protein
MGNDRKNSELEVMSHWKPRPMSVRALVSGTAAFPAVASVLFAVLIALFVPKPSGAFATASWWIGLLGLSLIVFFISDRAVRRALPFAMLLELGLVFPGEAPSRFAIAKRAIGVREVGRFIAEERSATTDSDPVISGDGIVTLAAALNASDRKTRGHAERTRAIADLIGSELGLSDHDRERLRWAALLLHVGKLGVHSEISNKQGYLPPIEGDLMGGHRSDTPKVETPLTDLLGDWGSCISELREHFDGSGYPLGLAGEEISLGGRILAVAETYDSLTSVRSYKGPISQDAARAEIARRGETQFDPTVVRAFLAIPARRRTTMSVGTWLEMLPDRFDGFDAKVVCRAGAALLVLGSVLGIAAWASSSSHAGTKALGGASAGTGSTTHGAPAVSGSSTAPGISGHSISDTQLVSGHPDPKSTSKRSSPARNGKPSQHTGAPVRTTSRAGGTNGHSSAGSGHVKAPSPTSSGTTPPTTGSPPGSTPPTSRTPPPTSRTPPPTSRTPPPSTTTTTDPAPGPATAVVATAVCEDVFVDPAVTLKWTDSTSRWVTSYEILRRSNSSDYEPISNVSARATSFTDTRVAGLGTTYWYEVSARSPEGSSTSAAVSATTPVTCLSGGPVGPAGQAGTGVQKTHGLSDTEVFVEEVYRTD